MKNQDIWRRAKIDHWCFQQVAAFLHSGHSIEHSVAIEFKCIVNAIVIQRLGCPGYSAFQRAVDTITPQMMECLLRVSDYIQDPRMKTLKAEDEILFPLIVQAYDRYVQRLGVAEMVCQE